MKKQLRIPLWLNIVLLALAALAIIYVTVRYAPEIINMTKNPDEFARLIKSYGSVSVLVFMFFQVLQVVIAAIPGEITQLAGGYIFGIFFGTIYSTVGILVGAVIVFSLSRFLGYSLVANLVSEKNISRFDYLMNSEKAETAMFFLFLIPGIPKDILVYIAGLTPIKPLRFFIIFTVGRLPAIFGSSFIGANLQQKEYVPVIILSVISCILFIAGFLFKEKLMNKLRGVLNGKTNEGMPK